MLRCEGGTLYTGYTTDVQKRYNAHLSGSAKYTTAHKPLKIEAIFEFETKSMAMSVEYKIKKKLTKAQKEELVLNTDLLNQFIK